MKCPYNAKLVEQVNQNHYEYDENGYNTFHQHKLVEAKMLMDCLEQECAAWQNGRCRYRGD